MAGLTQNGARENDKAFENGKDYQAEQVEQSYVATKPTLGQKAKRHCARFWWVHLIIFCIVFLIVSLCLVYVGMPRIAQHDVNRSSIEFTDIQFLEPTKNSIVLTQQAILHSPSMFTPTLDPFNASLWLVTNGTFGPAPMLQVEMPRIHALHPSSNQSILNQNCTIQNLDQVTQYAITVLTNENVTTALTGRTDLHLGKLPTTNVGYNTSTTYKGLNGLKGFNVTGAKLNATAEAGQPNLSGFAYVPNPSVLTIVMGNVSLILSTGSTVVGTSTINNMTLKPGNNTLPMTAIINQTLVLTAMDKKTGIVDLTIAGNSSVYNGQHLSYYEKALSSNVLHLQMNVTQVLLDSLGL